MGFSMVLNAFLLFVIGIYLPQKGLYMGVGGRFTENWKNLIFLEKKYFMGGLMVLNAFLPFANCIHPSHNGL